MFFLFPSLWISQAARGLFFVFLSAIFPVPCFSATVPLSQDFLDAAELVTKSDTVLQGFWEDPSMKWFRKNIGAARGVFIAPQILRGSFLIGSSGGSGVMFARGRGSEKWSYPGFYDIDSVSMGLQIGADASEIVMLVMTDRGMEAMLTPEFKMDSDILVAAGPVGGVNHQQVSADIIAYARSMMGVINGVSLAGAILTHRGGLNNAYYGRSVSIEDILQHQVVSNLKADSLRKKLAIMAGGRPDAL